MARRKGSVTSAEHRAKIAEAQRERHARMDKADRECPLCGQTCRGEQGLVVHLGMSHEGELFEEDEEGGEETAPGRDECLSHWG